MNFLIHAALPRRMAGWFSAAGCNAVHTLDLPDRNRTIDEQIIDAADREQRIVITRDADFVDTYILRGRPARLPLISSGNISNRDLEVLGVPLIPEIVREFLSHAFLELGRTGITIRGSSEPAERPARPKAAANPARCAAGGAFK